MKPWVKAMWIILFAVAMGYLETSVVVYLRALYYPEGFNFPLKPMSQSIALTELYREAATLIMILAISLLAARDRLQRFAWFLVVFATWDITYYVFLKLLLDWPESFLTNDILFLLPSIWTGPVLAPVINSCTMLVLASVILVSRKGDSPLNKLRATEWILLILGSLLILIAYTKDYAVYMIDNMSTIPSAEISPNESVAFLSSQFVTQSFDWLLFGIGLLMHLAAIILIFLRKRIS